jgi:L-seryl-tRNA(Ser) seleniumtransferase
LAARLPSRLAPRRDQNSKDNGVHVAGPVREAKVKARGNNADRLRKLPAVDQVLRGAAAQLAVDRYGRDRVVKTVRELLADARTNKLSIDGVEDAGVLALARLDAAARPNLRPVFNLTGTVLHTNLGRAILAEQAIEAAVIAMRSTVSLEFDLAKGERGDRDDHVRALLCELTGAEDATFVNNNAAAVLLVLNTLAKGREAIVSRGELIEIGGAFRMPEIMSRAGAKLVEVGTTNRTHKKDYVGALGAKTGLILKVHTSNYRIEGFTKEVSARELADIARRHKIPLVNDLGSGTLIDLARFGLRHESTVAEAVAEGADLVTFSGDKLLGGPQAGFIVGQKELIEKINRNPMKRALRVDKIRLAAIEATLNLYRDPDRLAASVPTLRMLAQSKSNIAARARRIIPAVSAKLNKAFVVEAVDCESQIGSGAMPLDTIASAGLAIRPTDRKAGGRALAQLAAVLRALPIPVIGRIEKQALVLDLRCLEDEAAFIDNLKSFNIQPSRGQP